MPLVIGLSKLSPLCAEAKFMPANCAVTTAGLFVVQEVGKAMLVAIPKLSSGTDSDEVSFEVCHEIRIYLAVATGFA